VRLRSGLHLTYCTNIHPGHGWAEVEANLQRVAPGLKARLSPSAPFGLGLRLAASEATELLRDDRLDRFRAFLDREGLYVALINGFPYGSFHGSPVKTAVYAPDWRDPARLAYTLNLIEILQRLLPAGVDGGVSTSPLSYKPWMTSGDPEHWNLITDHIAQAAEALVRARETHGVLIHLDIEPEPDCLIENTSETIAFFERWLDPVGAPKLATRLHVPDDDAQALLREHIRVCFDCCHVSVEFEDPLIALDRLRRAGIQVGRVQLSSALKADLPAGGAGAMASRLRPFADTTYLHQVVERQRGQPLRHFPDLGAALDAAPAGGSEADREWRIHFHVPLFTAEYDGLASSQSDVRAVLHAVSDASVTNHLEIETYTWDVLPPAMKLDVSESIAREYEWVLGVLGR
jgi:sugar phosphate isomerase/epimerase